MHIQREYFFTQESLHDNQYSSQFSGLFSKYQWPCDDGIL